MDVNYIMWCVVVPWECNHIYNPPSERGDCGYPGISEAECRSNDCCWDDSILDVNWCFYRI